MVSDTKDKKDYDDGRDAGHSTKGPFSNGHIKHGCVLSTNSGGWDEGSKIENWERLERRSHDAVYRLHSWPAEIVLEFLE
jgi:hypothetical protein